MIPDPSSFITSERPDSLARQVHDYLCEMLLSGQLRPDDRMSMRDLADRLKVSVMPVREAVSRLVASGALEVRPNRAVAVPVLTRAGFQDLTEIRIHNETYAARLATRRISVRDIDELHRLNEVFRDSLDSPDGRNAVRANKALHFHVYVAAGSPILSEVITTMWLKAGPVINLDLGDASRRNRNAVSLQNHNKMVTAIERRDADAAAAALAADIRSAAEFILSRDALRG